MDASSGTGAVRYALLPFTRPRQIADEAGGPVKHYRPVSAPRNGDMVVGGRNTLAFVQLRFGMLSADRQAAADAFTIPRAR